MRNLLRTALFTAQSEKPVQAISSDLDSAAADLARNMIQLAAQYTAREQVRFTGIDLFEMRPATSPGLSLKQTHSLLTPSGARVQLVPGDPFSALARTANSLLDTDLVVIRADQDPASLQRAWFYLPRMLHEKSVVLVEQPGCEGRDGTYRVLDLHAIWQLADAQTIALAVPPRHQLTW